MAGRLLAAVNARVQRFTESGDQSAVLDLTAIDEASQLWEAAMATYGDPHDFPVDVLTTLADLHLARHQALPEGQDQVDLQIALRLFKLLDDLAPERVPQDIRTFLLSAQPESAADAHRLVAEGARAFNASTNTRSLGDPSCWTQR